MNSPKQISQFMPISVVPTEASTGNHNLAHLVHLGLVVLNFVLAIGKGTNDGERDYLVGAGFAAFFFWTHILYHYDPSLMQKKWFRWIGAIWSSIPLAIIVFIHMLMMVFFLEGSLTGIEGQFVVLVFFLPITVMNVLFLVLLNDAEASSLGVQGQSPAQEQNQQMAYLIPQEKMAAPDLV